MPAAQNYEILASALYSKPCYASALTMNQKEITLRSKAASF